MEQFIRSQTYVEERPNTMSLESLLALILSLPIGIAGGLYSSLIVTKYARFSELRAEALRIIRSIRFVGDDNKLEIFEPNNLNSMALIASDLAGLGHETACETVLEIYNAILYSNSATIAGEMRPTNYMDAYADWQRRTREISPNKRIYLPWGWP
ncbi:hypothetical protein JAK53_10595 [Stenotrophomonas maltophilia]|uniref:hypothetical protein n=1 Tax=Stenotrophomonas TaxID=40323 RepID=UPI0018D33B5A|nr:hypothetical protein [Stenotrophomonas maltophilia]MBH1816811.1 hypothetical protein [Stenotrophomonas maltophilia]MCU1029728.1 hypothetical protein [Stenotrophomonas maltophilia]